MLPSSALFTVASFPLANIYPIWSPWTPLKSQTNLITFSAVKGLFLYPLSTALFRLNFVLFQQAALLNL
jgi:hypothetical protein